jgi:ferrochelatase
MGAILDVSFIPSWHKHPLFIATTALHVKAALDGFGEGANKSIPVIFTAHSLPARIVEMGDPYPHQVRETCQAIADELHLFSWTLAYQSASQTGVPWLGPDVLEAMASLHAQGYRRLLIAPIGFVADNLETLYDIDVVYSQEAKRQGIDLRRMACLNDDPLFINALGSIIRGCTL